ALPTACAKAMAVVQAATRRRCRQGFYKHWMYAIRVSKKCICFAPRKKEGRFSVPVARGHLLTTVAPG
ncbi:MAG TPA: hypothetical protein VFG46_22150, partial [Chryseolinea sp.]|nr:hypothetical protein [Chryseolinea sp.]